MAPFSSTTTDSRETDASGAGLNPDVPYRRALIVANPIAGRGHGAKAGHEVQTGLRRMGVAAELHLSTERGDARRRVRCMDPATDLVVSVGGDGTLREVFDGLVDPDVPVALLPLGTGNVLGTDLALPRDVDGLLELIAGRRTTAIDVADVDGQLAFLAASAGFDGRVVHELEARRRGPISRLSYVGAVLRALRGYRAPKLTVELDGERQPGTFGLVIVSNVVHYGGVLKLEAGGTRDDGHYDVYLFRRADPLSLLLAGLRGVLASLPGGGNCRAVAARHVRVTADEPVPCQVDGDARGHTPLELSVRGGRRRLIVP